MRKLLFTLCISIVLCTNIAANAILFQENDFKTVQAQALKLNKSFFIYYYGKHCPPCEMMKENTFSNPDIIKIANDNFIAAKTDLNSKKGRDWRASSKASVVYMPTIVFFSPQGKFINKYEGWISPRKFEKILKNNMEIGQIMNRDAPSYLRAPRAPAKTETKKKERIPATAYTPTKNATKPQATIKERPKEENVIVQKAKPLEKKSAQINAAPVKKEQPKYDIEKLEKPTQSIYVVQLGVFSNAQNINQYIDEMKRTTKRENIYCLEDIRGERPMYRIITGKYKTVKEALTLVEQLKGEGITAFVKKL